jgi:hypothetical protein
VEKSASTESSRLTERPYPRFDCASKPAIVQIGETDFQKCAFKAASTREEGDLKERWRWRPKEKEK